MYPITTDIYIQTDEIIDITVSTRTVKMANADTHVVTAAQVADIVRCVNENHA